MKVLKNKSQLKKVFLYLVLSSTVIGCVNSKCQQLSGKDDRSSQITEIKIEKDRILSKIEEGVKLDVDNLYNDIKNNNRKNPKRVDARFILINNFNSSFKKEYIEEKKCMLYILKCQRKANKEGNRNKLKNEKIVWKNSKTLIDLINDGAILSIADVENFKKITPKKETKKQKSCLEDKIKEDLKCVICLDIFKKPITIQCGHSYCFLCISSNMKYDKENHVRSRCPQCRKLIKYGAKNFVLCKILQDLKHTK